MLSKAIIFILSAFLLSSCVTGPEGYFKKSANNKLFDRKGFKNGKRAPLYNKKYIVKAKQNVANNDYEDDEEEYDSLLENENISQALIFEDDALFSSLFNLNNIKLDIQFNLLFLGGRFQPNFMMTPQTSAKVADNIVVHNYTYWDPTFHDRTAHAYIITFEFAKFLIELFNIIDDPPPIDKFFIKYTIEEYL